MKRVSMLLVGGIKDSKAVTLIKNLKDDLFKKEITADLQFVNSYNVNDLSKYEDKVDGIITIGVTNIKTKLPVINGLGLLYEWLGKDELFKGIEKISYDKE